MRLNQLSGVVVAWALALPAVAVPSIDLVDNGDGSATLNVILDVPGAIGAEIGVSFGPGLALFGIPVVNSSNFDQPNPGDNPFLPGSPVGGDSTGLAYDESGGAWIFASFGADLPVGTHEFFTFDYAGAGGGGCGGGGITASGVVAQGGVLGAPLMDSNAIAIDCLTPGDANDDGRVDLADLDILGTNFGLEPATRAQGDFNFDGRVDLADLDILGSNFGAGFSTATAAPEPSALSLMALVPLMIARRCGC